MRRCAVLLLLALTDCRKPPPGAPPPAAPAAVEQKNLVADAGSGRIGCREDRLGTSDGGLTAFAGFSGDEQQFAFVTYSEGAGADLLNVIDSQNRLTKRLTLGGDKDEIEAKQLIDRGRFDASGYVSDFEFKLEGPTVHVLSHGQELWKGEPFGEQGAGNLRVQPWGCSRTRTHGAIIATVSSGTEFGDVRTFATFELPQGGK